MLYIDACQRGGVSNKPPGLQAVTRHGARDPLVRSQVDLFTDYRVNGPCLVAARSQGGSSETCLAGTRQYT